MPCVKCKNGKWRIGKEGDCFYKTKKSCEEALSAYYANRSLLRRGPFKLKESFFNKVKGQVAE